MGSIINNRGNLSREGTSSGCNPTNNTIQHNPTNTQLFERMNVSDLLEWQQRRKRKRTEENVRIQVTNKTSISDPLIEQLEVEAEKTFNMRWHVARLGTMNNTRPDGVYRLMGIQLNSMSSHETRDRKVSGIQRLIEEWDVQGVCFQEV